MSSRKNGGKAFYGSSGSGNGHPSQKRNMIDGSSSGQGTQKLDQPNHDLPDLGMDPAQEGEWEVIGKKSKNRSAACAPKSWGPSTSDPAPKAWDQSHASPRQVYGSNIGTRTSGGSNWPQANDSRRPGGRGIPRPQPPNRSWEAAYMKKPCAIPPPPLKNGWQWAGKGSFSDSQRKNNEENIDGSIGGYGSESDTEPKQSDNGSDDDDLVEDSDDDLSDDYDSDVSKQSHGTLKKRRCFKGLFEAIDKLTAEEINEQSREWHCPVCQDGPGAIDWYKGLQSLTAHAKTKGATKVKRHRKLAELLDEELRRRGTSVIPAGEAFGKWKGLRDPTSDHEIVWPPMVLVKNTLLEQNENDKWVGMGNQELLEYFSTYQAVKSRHSYGPQGHRGMSLLLFEATAMGYLEAERLDKHFAEEGRDRDAWERRRVLFGPGGKRQLYGFLASKEDMGDFNQHHPGKSRVKFEMKSHQEMVVIPMKQMSEDNQQLIWLKNKVVKQQQRSKVLEESFGVVSQKLRETMEENRIVRLRTKIQHEENKEEMDYQEQFFKDQIAKVHGAIEEREKDFEKQLQEERAKAKQFELNSETKEDNKARKEETSRFIDNQVKGVEEFEEEREKCIHAHEEKKVELRRKYLKEEVELEEEFEAALSKLMEKYAPTTFQASSAS